LPALAFESLDVEASAMPSFLGKWVTTGSTPVVELWLGLCFVAIYAVLAFATYPFARRGRVPATLAVVVPAVLILGWIGYGISRF
jgi:lipopolysaccharide export LptBFGC system permease protein LptF